MSSGNVKIEMGIGRSRSIDLFADFLGSMEDMQKQMPEIERKALNVGASVLRHAITNTMISRWPASSAPFIVKTPKHPAAKKPYITKPTPIAADAVRQSRSRNGVVSVAVTGGEPHSASYIAKMYNTDSKIRVMRVRLGKKLNKPKRLGKIRGLGYFEPGVMQGEAECYNAMERVIFNRLEKIYE